MIEVKSVSKRFGKFQALTDVHLDVAAGEAIALWGPNGAGKSTLVRCLLGLLPFKGEARIAGLDVRRRGKAARRQVGYLPQEPALFDDLRIGEVTLLFARLKRASRAEARLRIREAGLEAHLSKRVRELSGGMKQRLSLGLALLTDPPILILDEPTSNLDTDSRAEVLEDVDKLRAAGKTVLLISHRPEEVRRIADRVVTLESGRIVSSEATQRSSEGTGRRALWVDEGRWSEAQEALQRAGIETDPAQTIAPSPLQLPAFEPSTSTPGRSVSPEIHPNETRVL